MFEIGEFVIYKMDLCIIKEIKEKHLNNKDYYVLIPEEDKSLIINVPVENKNQFLRKLITKERANEIISNIPNIEIIDCNDKSLENEYKKLLNSNTHEGLIKIIKTTYLRNKERIDHNKCVGDKDIYYFNKAETYFYNELSKVLNLSIEQIKEYIANRIENLDK